MSGSPTAGVTHRDRRRPATARPGTARPATAGPTRKPAWLRVGYAAGLATAACILASGPAHATTAKDAELLGRVFGFVQGVGGPEVTVAIAFDPATEANAKAFAALLGSGYKAGKLTLVPKLVPVDQPAQLAGAAAVFLPPGLNGRPAIAGAAKSAKVLTFSSETGCAEAGDCVIALQSEPKVLIVLNQSAADMAGLAFAAAFRLLVKQI